MIDWVAMGLVVYSVAATIAALDRQIELWRATDELRERGYRLARFARQVEGHRERIRELKPDEFAATDDAGDVIRAIVGGTELPDVE